MPTKFDRFERIIDCTVTTGATPESEPFVIPVGPYLTGSIQSANQTDTSWASGILTIQVSNNAKDWATAPSWVVSASTITADGITSLMDLSGILYLRVAVTTAEATLQVKLTFCGKGDA